jgi:hypothetical protein
MPWQIDGTFLRENTDYTADPDGRLWGQDLSASIKIIASRHDFHDQDLGNGIADCVNLDGYNSMRANLKMGDNKITGVGDAFALNDVPGYGQCAGTFTWVEGTSTLTLNDRNGNPIDSIVITASGGGGSGTVTEINIGDGLTSTNNPIQTTADLSLEVLDPAATYQGGIAAISIDKHGRVTQVTEGAFANTNLGNTWSEFGMTITSSTGSDTVLGSATEARAGVMTAAQVQTLNSLAAGSGDPDQFLQARQTAGQLQIGISRTGASINYEQIPRVTTSDDGAMAFEDKIQLEANTDYIAALPATASNVPDKNATQNWNGDNRFNGDIEVNGILLAGSIPIPGVLGTGLFVASNGEAYLVNLPAADPGNPGQLYRTGGAVMISI